MYFDILTSTIPLEELPTVYVNQRTGTNRDICGISRTTPCNDLQQGVDRTKTFGTVYVMGEYNIQEKIELKRNITIVSDHIQQGIITSDESTKLAFKSGCQKDLTLKLKGLLFKNVRVINVHCQRFPNIVISGITVLNASFDKGVILFEYRPLLDIGYKTGTLNIWNSHFEDTSGIALRNVRRVQIINCILLNPAQTNISSPLIYIRESLNVLIENCQFNHVKGITKFGSFVLIKTGNLVIIKNCTFKNGTANLGCVHVWNVKTVNINRCQFKRCSSLSKESVDGGKSKIQNIKYHGSFSLL